MSVAGYAISVVLLVFGTIGYFVFCARLKKELAEKVPRVTQPTD